MKGFRLSHAVASRRPSRYGPIASRRRIRTSKSRSRGLSSARSSLSCARTTRSMRREKPARTAPLDGNASRKSASETPAVLQMSRIEMSSKRCSLASSISASTILPRGSAGFASLFTLLAMGRSSVHRWSMVSAGQALAKLRGDRAPRSSFHDRAPTGRFQRSADLAVPYRSRRDDARQRHALDRSGLPRHFRRARARRRRRTLHQTVEAALPLEHGERRGCRAAGRSDIPA